MLKTDEFDRAMVVKEISPQEESGVYVRLPGPPRSDDPEPAFSVRSVPPPPLPPVIQGTSRSDPKPVQTARATDRTGGASPESDTRKTEKKSASSRSARRVSKSAKGKGKGAAVVANPSPTPRKQPLFEDDEGFVARRPIVDPYRVNERITLEASYFNVVAGDITLETRPFVEVNGRQSYRFAGTARSTSVFAMFYAVDDWFETLVDYETMIPYSYALHVKESKQLRETRTLFDWDKLQASYWDKKINSEKRLEEKNYTWKLAPYAQNVFSAPFYLRSFQLSPGKRLAFRVGHEKQNLVLTAEVVRREKISTPAGDFNTVVVKPTLQLDGKFKPMGDIFVWFTDDDRKFIVRIESKIKIGKIVAVAKKVEPGQP